MPNNQSDSHSEKNPSENIFKNPTAVRTGTGIFIAATAAFLRFPFDKRQKDLIYTINMNTKSQAISSDFSTLWRSMRISAFKSLVTGRRKDTHNSIKQKIQNEDAINAEQAQTTSNPTNLRSVFVPLITAGSIIGTADTCTVSFLLNKNILKKAKKEEMNFLKTLSYRKQYALLTRFGFISHSIKNAATATSLLSMDNLNDTERKGMLAHRYSSIAGAILFNSIISNMIDVFQFKKAQSVTWNGKKLIATSLYSIIKQTYQTQGILGFTTGLGWNIKSTTVAFVSIQLLNTMFQASFVKNEKGEIELSDSVRNAFSIFTEKRNNEDYFLSPHGFFYAKQKPTQKISPVEKNKSHVNKISNN